MNKIILTFNVLLTIIIVGCNDIQNPNAPIPPSETKHIKVADSITKNEIFKNRDKNINNYIFMNYWIGMNPTEFEVISDSLVNLFDLIRVNNKLIFQIQQTYKSKFDNGTSNCMSSFLVIPNYNSENKLIGIDLKPHALSGCNHLIVDIFSEKYGNPKIENVGELDYYGTGYDINHQLTTRKIYHRPRFTQYIWKKNRYIVCITLEYGFKDNPEPNTEIVISTEVPQCTSYSIKYIIADQFLSERSKESIEEKNENQKIIKSKEKVKQVI